MADDYVMTGQAVPSRFEKLLRVFIFLAVLCLGGELVWLIGVGPSKPFSRIDIIGPAGISREEIIAKAGITSGSSWFSTDVSSVEQALMGISSLESVRVFKNFPSRLQIVLEGRKPVAAAFCNIDGRTLPVIFDSNGVVYEIGGAVSSRLPVISGLFIEDPFPGMQLPSMFLPLFKQIEKVGMSAPELLGAVSEIKIVRNLHDTFDIILFPTHKKIKVRLSELNEDLLRYTLLMVDVLSLDERGIDSVDFRSGIASYKPLEANL
jgi:cell division protein FtsQ